MRKIETFVNEDKLYILWRTKVTNFRKVMKFSQITVLKLRTIFLKFCQNNYMQEISPLFDFFCISKLLIVWCRYNQVIRVMSKKLPTLPRGSLSIKCLNLSRDSSIPRQKKKKRNKVGIDCILWRV